MKNAREALAEGRYDDAIAAADEILDEGMDIDALEVKGEAYRLKGEPKEAMKCYDRALVVNLNKKTIWKGKGICLLAVGRTDEARRSFDRAVKIDADYAEGWLERGRMGMRIHDWQLALESFERSTVLDPDCDLGWYNKANALITGFGRMEEAVECYERALKINSTSADYWFSLGVAQKSTASILEAASSFKRSLDIDPNNSLARKYMEECVEFLRSQGLGRRDIFARARKEPGEEPDGRPDDKSKEEVPRRRRRRGREGRAKSDASEDVEDWGAPPPEEDGADEFFELTGDGADEPGEDAYLNVEADSWELVDDEEDEPVMEMFEGLPGDEKVWELPDEGGDPEAADWDAVEEPEDWSVPPPEDEDPEPEADWGPDDEADDWCPDPPGDV